MTSKALLLSVLVLLVPACGSEVAPQNDDDGDGGSGASGGTGAATGSGGSGGGLKCPEFADEPGSAEVTLRFRNESGKTIYLPGGCSTIQYSLEPIGGDGETAWVWEPSCLQTCETLQEDSPSDCGACAALTFVLEPGGTLDTIWNGTGLHGTDMPAACFADSVSTSCSQIVAAPAGEYRAYAHGFAECEDETPDGVCSCTPDGQCNGYPTGAQAYSDQAKFLLGQDSIVEVVFGGCAFPCP